MEIPPVLEELLTVLPEWTSRLHRIASEFHDHGNPAAPINPGEPEKSAPVKRNRPISPSEEKARQQAADMGAKKLNAKPSATKAKFSSITGPEIYYNGDQQQCLFECWTALNAKRGYLRKEMMQMKRKKVLTFPSANYGYSDSDEDIEADDSDDEESEEDRLKRLEEERRKEEEEKQKQAADKKKSEFLEYIDGCLDRAAKACENAAFVWLKGEACTGHVLYISQRMAEAMDRIKIEMHKLSPAKVEEDEGFGDEIGLGEDEESEEELPHKKAGQRPDPERPDPGAGIPNPHPQSLG